MADNMEITVIGREVVKPSSPTPANLSRFNLSLLDQCTDDRFVPFTWFYSGNGTHQFPQKCEQLKSSLAQTLSLFYPMAGRIRDPNDHWVECCDDGVEFVEAQMNCSMTRILGSNDPDVLKLLVPVDPGGPVMIWNRKSDEPLCVFQATLFECGGVAVTVCLTHKLADGATYFGFTRAWGTIASRSGAVELPPKTGLSSIVPPIPGAGKPSAASNLSSDTSIVVVTRRFVFKTAKMEELKAVASSSVVRRPTRVEAVMGLIWKCAVAASRSVKRDSSSSSSLSLSTGPQHSAACVAMNLRKRMKTTIVSKNTIGNLVGAAFATSEMREEIDLAELVVELRKGVEVVNERMQGVGGVRVNYYKEMEDTKKQIEEKRTTYLDSILSVSFEVGAKEVLMTGLVDLDCSYMFTSVCGALPIDLDLGFGRSVWVTPILCNKNTVMLMDNIEEGEQLQRGGVQALVTLGEQEMELFQNNKLLLSFGAHAINHHLPLKSNL